LPHLSSNLDLSKNVETIKVGIITIEVGIEVAGEAATVRRTPGKITFLIGVQRNHRLAPSPSRNDSVLFAVIF